MRLLNAALLCSLALVGCGGSGGDDGSGQQADKPPADGKEPQPQGPALGDVGDTLKTADDYTSNDDPVNERLSLTVESVKDNATPSQPDVAEFTRKKGHRWLQVKLRVRQTGSTPTLILTESFAALDADDQQFAADGNSVFEPSLAPSSNSVDLEAGQTRVGFLSIQVPKGVKVTEIEFKDPGFGPQPDSARWKLP